jgi:uncharacterized protein (TIGR02145 family)
MKKQPFLIVTLLIIYIANSFALKTSTIPSISKKVLALIRATGIILPLNTFVKIINLYIFILIVLLTSCSKKQFPTISTLPINKITGTTASAGGNVSDDGGANVNQRGLVWGTNPIPTTGGSQTNNGSGAGIYTGNISGLTPNTNYYLRAYATNSEGTSYGNLLNFTTTSGANNNLSATCGATNVHNQTLNYGSITDVDGNSYKTIIIGTQEWMAENLKTTKYRNGESVAQVTDSMWMNLNSGAWTYYENNSQYDCPLGKLYNWYAVIDSRNLCPSGWHIPSDIEWNILIGHLDPNYIPNPPTNSADIQSEIAGGKMKNTGTKYWLSPNTDATNESGFSGLPGGQHTYYSRSEGYGYDGAWWCTNEYDPYDALSKWLDNKYGYIYRYHINKLTGLSIRCIKD